MKIKSEKIEALIADLESVISKLKTAESEHQQEIQQVHPDFKNGAKNLVHYRAFRSLDLKKLQKRLSSYGLSILASTESHVFTTLTNSLHILKALHPTATPLPTKRSPSIKSSVKQQKKHAKDLFGYRSKGRRVRIMVTLPSEAAYNYKLVRNLVASGMNTARINCAHDRPEIWQKMIQHLNKAKTDLHKNCRLFMDLAGPKIRTGRIEEGLKVIKFKPKRNELGKVIKPATVKLVSSLTAGSTNEIQVEQIWLDDLKKGDTITFKDTRKKKRTLLINDVHETGCLATCKKTCYIQNGVKLTVTSSLSECEVENVSSIEPSILLKKGELLRVLKDQLAGKPAIINSEGSIQESAFISCTAPDVFDAVKQGEVILFDDGKIGGVIKEVSEKEFLVEITQVKADGTKLKADKGINLPNTELTFNGLTRKDKEDLRFIVQYADAVNVSFINSATDVQELYSLLEQLDANKDLGIVLKIENKSGYQRLFEVLLIAMQRYPVGVMIARGDLAIEAGWENLPRIQNEILRLCDSAYIPTVWATQVLENMAKKGIPSRSELTDVASSLKADCVMLNKGPYILDTVHLLHKILSSMNTYRDKDVRMFEAIDSK